jgi:tRNA nucleotidyltransferase (CCA-adding enzyme)
MSGARWELLPHGADIGVCGIGRSKAEAFGQAAVALTAVITDPLTVSPTILVEIACAAPDDELLLVEWLNALVYEVATRKMLFARFEVRIDDHELAGKVWREPIDRSKHDLGVEVKGATCTNLSVKRDETGQWFAECVVDVWTEPMDTARLQRRSENQWWIAPTARCACRR